MTPIEGPWLQATYTSADGRNGARGGWGVKDVSGDLPPHLLKTLERGFLTTLDEVEPTPAFATADELDRRPRRLVHQHHDGAVVLWHAASAGHDATGRPGNVFNHAAVLSAPTGRVRPIEMWRSPDLLTPFGALAVAEARLPQALRPGVAVTRETVAAFVGSDDRIFALEWLVAAVAHAFREGIPVLVVVPTPDEAAMWMGAVSYATSAAHARRLNFVTYERRSGLDRAAEVGFTMIFVPPGEIAPDDASHDLLCLDPTRDLDDTDPLVWRDPSGQTFPACRPWQSSVLDVYATGAPTIELLGLIDEVSSGLTTHDAQTVPLEWPLAAALLSSEGAGVADRAQRVATCLAQAPASVLGSVPLQRLIEEAVADRTTRDLALAEAAEGGRVWQLLQESVVTAYLQGGWQSADAAPTGRGYDPVTFRSAALDAVHGAADDVAGPPDIALRAARVIGFVADHELAADPASGEPEPEVAAAIDAVVERATSDDRGFAAERWVELGSVISGRIQVARQGVRQAVPSPSGPPLGVTSQPPPPTGPPLDGPPQPPLPTGLSQPPLSQPPSGAPSSLQAPPSPPPPTTPMRPSTDAAADSAPMPLGSDIEFGQDPPKVWTRPGQLVPSAGNDDGVERLRELLRSTVDEPVRAEGVADAILALHGVQVVPLRSGHRGIHAQLGLVESVALGLPGSLPGEREAALRWLAAFHALAEARRLGDSDYGGHAPGVEPTVLKRLQASPAAFDGIRAVLVHGSIEDAGGIFAVSAQRMVLKTAGVLGLQLDATERLGWATVRAVWRELPPAWRQDVLAVAKPRLAKISEDLGGQAANLQALVRDLVDTA